MPFISASAITPYNSIRGGAAGEALDPILAYSPFNVWDSEHETRVGTTTTFLDYNNVGTAYDLANPAASNQPSYNSSSSDFNSVPSFTFNGSSQYVRKTISGYRESDSSGMFISVYRLISGINIADITISNSSLTNRYVFNQINSDTLRTYLLTDTSASFRGSTNINDNDAKVIAYGNSGSVYKSFVGSNSETITMLQGSNDGSVWLDGTDDYNNLTIGALERTTLAYSNIEWCFSGYFPYVDDATTLEIIAILKTKYSI